MSDLDNIKSIDLRIYFDPEKIKIDSNEKVSELIYMLHQIKCVENVEVNHLESLHNRMLAFHQDMEEYLAFVFDAREIEE